MKPSIRNTGFTLIEMMMVLAVMAILALQGLPQLSSFMSNSKLREGATTIASAAALARSEAIKRNSSVRLTVTGTELTISRESDNKTLRALALPAGISTTMTNTAGAVVANSSVLFNSEGLLSPFGTALSFTTSLAGKTCSDDLRCPAVLVEGGGATNVCARGAANGVCI